MNEHITFPDHIIRFGVALTALRGQHQDDCEVWPAVAPGPVVLDVEPWLQQRLNEMKDFGYQLPPAIERLMQEVIAQPAVSVAQQDKAVAELDAVLCRLNRQYLETAAATLPYGFDDARDALLACYQDLHQQVMDWLDRVCAAIADPASALAVLQAGTPPTLNFHLSLQPPAALPEMIEAFELAMVQTVLPQTRKQRGGWFWPFVLGVAIGSVWADDDE